MNMVNGAARVAGIVGDITRVCTDSFFSGVASRRQRKRRTLTMTAVTLCAAIAVSITIVNANFSLAVYLNGEEVGAARSIAEVPRIVASAESQLTELLGYEYSLDGALTLVPSVGESETDEELEKAIILSVDGVSELYAITIGGEVIGAAEEYDTLYGVLKGILSTYTTQKTTSIRFLEDISITRELVTDAAPRDTSEITARLLPLLTVECIESSLIIETVPFETQIIDDDTLYDGETSVVTPGELGSVLVTQNVTLVNGAEVSRESVGRVASKAPVTEVVARGTMPRPKTASVGAYIWPAEGVVTSFFGYRSTSVGSSNHKGLDVAGFSGQDIYAADGGEVTFSGQSGGYGRVVIVLHDNGEETVYAHCSKLYVAVGERVSQGQTIAAMGRTGVASGVHCHFEIRVDGTQIDPLTRLNP